MSLNENQINELKKFFFGKLDYLCELAPEFRDFLMLRDKSDFFDVDTWKLSEDGFHICSGETKVVISFEDKNRDETNDWVIKIPFELCCAKYDDFCRIEAKNYLHAIEHHIDSCFAPMYFLGNYEIETVAGSFECPIYIMEKIEVNEAVNESYAYDNYNEDTYGYCSDFGGEEGAMMCLESSWNQDIIEMLDDFLFQFDINDIHAGNVGVNRQGQYVICDYSGY